MTKVWVLTWWTAGEQDTIELCASPDAVRRVALGLIADHQEIWGVEHNPAAFLQLSAEVAAWLPKGSRDHLVEFESGDRSNAIYVNERVLWQ